MMTSQKLFKRQEILQLVEKYFDESEFGLEHLNGEMYIFFNAFLVDKILFTQEIDIFIPFEEVYHGQKLNEKSYLRDQIVIEQYIEFYFEREENFSTMKLNSTLTPTIEDAYKNIKQYCNNIVAFLKDLSKNYDGDVKYTYQDRRYKEQFLQKKSFHKPAEDAKSEGPAAMGYFVEEKYISNKQLNTKEAADFVCLQDSLLEIFRDFYNYTINLI